MIEKVIMNNNTNKYHCIFCSIINGTNKGIIVYDNNHFLVLMDKYPISHGHTLVIPKKHYDNLLFMPYDEVGKLYSLVSIIAKEEELYDFSKKIKNQLDGLSILD